MTEKSLDSASRARWSVRPHLLGRYLSGNSTIGQRLLRAGLWSTLGTVGSRLFGIISAVVVARLLGREDYGRLAILLSTAAVFRLFADFGLGVTSTKYVAELRTKDPVRTGRIIGLSSRLALLTGAVGVVTMLASAAWISSRVLGASQLEASVRLTAPMLFFGALTGAQSGSLAGFEEFRKIAVANTATAMIALPLTVFGVALAGLDGALVGSGLACFFNWVLNRHYLRGVALQNGVSLHRPQIMREWRVIFRYSLPALLGGLAVVPTNWICSAMLVHQPDGFGQNGLFAAANGWFNAVIWLPAILAQATMPLLSQLIGIEDDRRSRKVLRVSIGVNVVLALPLVLLGSLMSTQIMRLYGRGFESAGSTLAVVLATAALVAVQAPVGQYIAAAERMWIGLFMNIGWSVAFLTATWYWVEDGALGLASARLVAYALHCAWTLAYAWHVVTANSEKEHSAFRSHPVVVEYQEAPSRSRRGV